MPGEYVLDTNIVIAFFAQEDLLVERLTQANFVVPAVVLGELYVGALRSQRIEQNLQRIDAVIPATVVLPCDATTARTYAELKRVLLAKGRPLPENDIWIAASAVQHGLTLVSRDAHFREVDGLSLEAW